MLILNFQCCCFMSSQIGMTGCDAQADTALVDNGAVIILAQAGGAFDLEVPP